VNQWADTTTIAFGRGNLLHHIESFQVAVLCCKLLEFFFVEQSF
jgi:hypothetical protein